MGNFNYWVSGKSHKVVQKKKKLNHCDTLLHHFWNQSLAANSTLSSSNLIGMKKLTPVDNKLITHNLCTEPYTQTSALSFLTVDAASKRLWLLKQQVRNEEAWLHNTVCSSEQSIEFQPKVSLHYHSTLVLTISKICSVCLLVFYRSFWNVGTAFYCRRKLALKPVSWDRKSVV